MDLIKTFMDSGLESLKLYLYLQLSSGNEGLMNANRHLGESKYALFSGLV